MEEPEDPGGGAREMSRGVVLGIGKKGLIPGSEDPLEEGTATHSSILAWRIPWTEEPGRLESTWLLRVRHD